MPTLHTNTASSQVFGEGRAGRSKSKKHFIWIKSWATAGGQGWTVAPPWIFIHGTDIVDTGLKVLFFGLFCYFSVFLFSLTPLEIFLPMPLDTILDLMYNSVGISDIKIWHL